VIFGKTLKQNIERYPGDVGGDDEHERHTNSYPGACDRHQERRGTNRQPQAKREDSHFTHEANQRLQIKQGDENDGVTKEIEDPDAGTARNGREVCGEHINKEGIEKANEQRNETDEPDLIFFEIFAVHFCFFKRKAHPSLSIMTRGFHLRQLGR